MPTFERIATGSKIPVEAECICPDKLENLAIPEIEKLAVFHGNRVESLAEHFKIGGQSGPEIHLIGDCSAVKWIGAGMSHGSIVAEGSVGMHLGSEMTGGTIEIAGDAGDWVGAEMAGGRIHVHGSVGHLIGAAYRGGKVGMRGGEILIDGAAGNEIGGQMRRGLLVVGGGCGDFAGVAMIAGTILVFGQFGQRPGAGMKRGTIGLLGNYERSPELLPTFQYDCDWDAGFLRLYLKRLTQLHFEAAVGFDQFAGTFARYSGDFLELGKGEILARRN